MEKLINVYQLATYMVQILKHKLHSPTLETIQMVEEAIKKAKGVLKVAELKRLLPRKVNHNTLRVILAYLQKSGKIEFTPYGVVWIFMPRTELDFVLSKGRTWT